MNAQAGANHYKFVVILNGKLEPGVASNAASHKFGGQYT